MSETRADGTFLDEKKERKTKGEGKAKRRLMICLTSVEVL